MTNTALSAKLDFNGSTQDWDLMSLDMFNKHIVHTKDQNLSESKHHGLSNKQEYFHQNLRSPKHTTISASSAHRANNISTKTIPYDPLTLKCIRDSIQHDQRYSVLPFGAVNNIRKLRINNKIKNRIHKRKNNHQCGVHRDNLLKIKCFRGKEPPSVVVATCNTQSI